MRVSIISVILLLLLMIGVQTASALIPITYSCCVNFTTSNGVQIDSFDSTTNWASHVSGVGTSVQLDTTNFIEGTGSLKVITTGGNSGSTSKDLSSAPINISNDDPFIINFFVDNPLNLSFGDIYFSSSGSALTNYTDYPFVANNITGWNRLVIFRSDMTQHGSVNWTINYMRLKVAPVTGANVNVNFDDLRYNVSGRPKALITFDDGYPETLTNAQPILSGNGQNGTVFLITGNVGTAGWMTLANLQALQNSGWAVSSHTVTHPGGTGLNGVNDTQLTTELNDSYAYLVNNGFLKSAQIFAYPGGFSDSHVVDFTLRRYVIAREYLDGNQSVPQNNDSWYNNGGRYKIKVVQMTNTTTNQTVMDRINYTINFGGIASIGYHRIVTNDLTNTNDVNITKLQATSNYLKSRSSDIDTIAYPDLLIPQIINYTPVVNKTVTIYSNGTVSLVTNNEFDEYMPNMTVIPSSDSVNITVSTWTTSGDYSKIWSESSSNHSVSTQHTIGDFPANTAIYMFIDGVTAQPNILISNSTGFVTFMYTGGFSDHTFQLATNVPDTTHSSIITSCNSAISWATIGFAMLVIVLLAAGGGMALMMLMTKTFDGRLLIRYVVVIVVIVIIGTIGLSIANPIVNLLGC